VSADPALVAALAEMVLPAGIAVAARNPRAIPHAADPDAADRSEADRSEALAIQGAVPARQAEFHAGRAAARAAMVALSLPPRPVPMGPDRAPLWPAGVTGSISHSATACVAALGHARDWAGIGVDIEEDSPLEPLLVAEICTRAERVWLGTQPGPERGLMAKLVFSAKEAAYKAQYPITGQLFGFDALEVRIDRVQTVFEARFLTAQGRFAVGTVLSGSYVHAAGLIVTGVALGQSDAR